MPIELKNAECPCCEPPGFRFAIELPFQRFPLRTQQGD